MAKERGVITNRPEADVSPSACPMHRIVLINSITEDGMLSPIGDGGEVAPMKAVSMTDFLNKADLGHTFESEVDGERFMATLKFDRMKSFDPKEIEKGGDERNDFAGLRRRRGGLAKAKMVFEKKPTSGLFLKDDQQRQAAVKALRQLANYLRASQSGESNG